MECSKEALINHRVEMDSAFGDPLGLGLIVGISIWCRLRVYQAGSHLERSW